MCDEAGGFHFYSFLFLIYLTGHCNAVCPQRGEKAAITPGKLSLCELASLQTLVLASPVSASPGLTLL